MKTISIIIPVFNEEKRLPKTFKALRELRLPRGLKLEEIIFVDDGSNDKTFGMIGEFRRTNTLPVVIISYKANKGKGHAVKRGASEAKGDFILIFDADLSTQFSELKKFMKYVKNGENVIIGTRKNGHSTVIKHQGKIREFLGRGFTLFTQRALSMKVTDFTCGFKLFSKKAYKKIFRSSQINGWGYDAEIIFLANKYGYKIREVAVVWSNDNATKVVLYKAVPRSIYEILKIVVIHRLGKPKVKIRLPNPAITLPKYIKVLNLVK